MKTSLIFGSTGFIGSKTVDFLSTLNEPIIVINTSKSNSDREFRFIKLGFAKY